MLLVPYAVQAVLSFSIKGTSIQFILSIRSQIKEKIQSCKNPKNNYSLFVVATVLLAVHSMLNDFLITKTFGI